MKVFVLTGLALGLTVAGAAGWAAWNSTAIAHRDVVGGGLHVEVVAPREPDLPASTIIAVGELRDGYVHDPERLQPPAVLDAEDAYIDSAWPEPEPLSDPSPERESGLVWTTLRPPPTQLKPHDYSFGFDQPWPEQPAGNAGRLNNAGASASNAPADTPQWDERGLD